MSLRSRVGMAAVSGVMLLAIAALSQLPVETHEGGAIVRLSWRAEAINVESCRTLSPEEQARVPAHMRRPQACTGARVDYEVVLHVDGTVIVTDTVSPSGARRDRPVYVFHDEALATGEHAVAVTFTALVPDDYEAGAAPVRREWAGPMNLTRGQIGLVTLDAEGAELIRR